MSDAAHGSRVGSQFGRYHLKRLLGSGGMGEVYEAEDTVRDRVVALKLMAPAYSEDPVFRKRLEREARSAGRLREPHVVPIHDYGEIDGQVYVDMRLIEGTDLGSMLNRFGPLPPARAVAIVRQIASALDAAHATGILHRDVKPANVLVSRDDFACLVDFGIASAATDEKLTRLGDVVGTYAYMAPERLTGDEENVNHRVDIYALACVLFECLTGSTPYRGNVASVMTAHVTQPPPRPSAVRPAIPKAFDQVIGRGMAKRPGDRYASAGDLATAAHQALTTPDKDRATDILQRAQTAITLGRAPLTAQPPPTTPAPPPSVPAAPPSTKVPYRQTPAPYPTVSPGPKSTPPPAAPGVGRSVMRTPVGGLPAATPPAAPHQWPGQAGPPLPPGVGLPAWSGPLPAAAKAAPAKRGGKLVLILVGVAGAFLAVVVLGVIGILTDQSDDRPAADPRIKVGDNGVLIGDPSAPTIDIFDEPICPSCGDFITSSASDIRRVVAADKIAVRYHLLSFLNSKSATGDYSTRAIAASLCVADANDADMYQKFYTGLFAPGFQPKEDASTDRTNSELVDLAESVGASSQVATCIESGDKIDAADRQAVGSERALGRLMPEWLTPAVFDGTRKVNIDDPGWVDALG